MPNPWPISSLPFKLRALYKSKFENSYFYADSIRPGVDTLIVDGFYIAPCGNMWWAILVLSEKTCEVSETEPVPFEEACAIIQDLHENFPNICFHLSQTEESLTALMRYPGTGPEHPQQIEPLFLRK